jgi:hypothetical protein
MQSYNFNDFITTLWDQTITYITWRYDHFKLMAFCSSLNCYHSHNSFQVSESILIIILLIKILHLISFIMKIANYLLSREFHLMKISLYIDLSNSSENFQDIDKPKCQRIATIGHSSRHLSKSLKKDEFCDDIILLIDQIIMIIAMIFQCKCSAMNISFENILISWFITFYKELVIAKYYKAND